MLSKAHGKAEAPLSPSIRQTLSSTKLQKQKSGVQESVVPISADPEGPPSSILSPAYMEDKQRSAFVAGGGLTVYKTVARIHNS